MNFLIVIEFAAGNNPVAEAQAVEAFFAAFGHAWSALIFGVWIVGASPGTLASQVAQGTAKSCLHPPDRIFVTEITPNTATVP